MDSIILVIIFSIIIAILLGISVTLIGFAICGVPKSKTKKNQAKIIRNMSSQISLVDDIAHKVAVFVEKKELYKMNEYKRERLLKDFSIIDYSLTPEEYIISAYVYGLLTSLLFAFVSVLSAIASIPFMPIVFLVLGIIAGVIMWRIRSNIVSTMLSKRKEKIEKELPRFVAVVTQNLKFDDNLPKIIEDYVCNEDSPLCVELNKSLADIKTGDYDNAMTRMASRVNSVIFSEVTRGLASALRGEDVVVYFAALESKLKEQQALELEIECLSLPNKTSMLVKIVLAMLIPIYGVMIGTSFGDNMSGFMSL